MKGIILAGGSGTRLHPITRPTSATVFGYHVTDPERFGVVEFDTGTHESLMEAGHFIQTIKALQGLKVACLEEIGYRQGWLRADRLAQETEKLKKTGYGKYLQRVIAQGTIK